MNDKDLRLKYLGYTIIFQEVPNEISLAINISGCPHHCEGCHSTYLWEYKGNYIDEDIDKIIQQYDGMITCVCFMGGDQNPEELIKILTRIKNTYGLKTCLYSGDDVLKCAFVRVLNYIKIGSYKKSLGGLDSIYTNQRFYSINKIGKDDDCKFLMKDLTYLFQKKEVLG